MDLKTRIEMVMKMNNLNSSGFADKIGVQRSSMSHILSGRNKASLDCVQKILESFPKVDPVWLVTGKQRKENVFVEKTLINNSELIEGDQKKNEFTKVKHENVTNVNQKSTDIDKIAERKKVKKIVTFYTDGTFDEHFPNE